MKKSDLLAAFGTLKAIGALFPPEKGGPLTKGAVSQWSEDIPELREYQLREIVPDIDRQIAKAKRSQQAAA